MLLKSFHILALPYYIFHHTYSLNLFDSSVLTRTILFDSSELATLPHQARQPKHGSSPFQGSYVFNLISIQKPKMCHLRSLYYWRGIVAWPSVPFNYSFLELPSKTTPTDKANCFKSGFSCLFTIFFNTCRKSFEASPARLIKDM